MTVPNEPGYFNQYDPADDYYEVRAIAGRVEQAREDNEIQSIIKGIIKSNFNTLYRNGQIVSGGGFTHDTANRKLINMSEGHIYIDGIVHLVPATLPGEPLTLVGSGTEYIGVLVTETMVDHLTDVGLKDPSVGYQNFGQPGANRLKITKQWVANNPSMIKVYEFKNGELAVQPDNGQIDLINQTLARRTYDESGNYTVSGFDVSVDDKDDGEFYAIVGNTSNPNSSSKAYVQGREIVKLLPERIPLKNGTNDTRLLENDEVTYTGTPVNITVNGTVYSTDGLLLVGKTRVKEFTEVFAEFRVEDQQVTHSGLGATDILTAGTDILKEIYQVSNTNGGPADYIQTTDYIKSGTNGISWAPPGAEPGLALYYVDYRYQRKLLPSEYDVLVDDETGLSYLDIRGLGTMPEPGYGITVSYNYYLERVDVLQLRSDGVIEVLKGVPEEVAAPKPVSIGMLGLCEIRIPAGAGASKAQITTYNTRRFTMEDLHRILTRLERTEYNQAIKDLDASAQTYAGASINTLAGILTEGFRYTAEDHVKDGIGGFTRVKYEKSLTNNRIIDIPSQEMVLPENATTANLVITPGTSTAKRWALSSTLATTSESDVEVSQLLATSGLKLNPYSIGANHPVIFISPTLDNDAETDTTISGNSELLAQSALIGARNLATANTQGSEKDNNFKQFGTGLKSFIKAGKLVHVRGFGYDPNSYVQAYFDNKKVALTAVTSSSGLPTGITLPSGGNTLAAADGKVQTNSDGEFLATFVTPTGIPTGNRAVVVSDAAENIASASFEGRGSQKLGVSSALLKVAGAPGVVPTPTALMSSNGGDSQGIVAPPPASVVTLTVPSNVASAQTINITGTYTGLAEKAVLAISDRAPQVFTIDQTSTSFSFTTAAQITQPVTYDFYLVSGTSGISEIKHGEIQFAGTPPSGTAPGSGNITTSVQVSKPNFSQVKVSWDFTGVVTNLVAAFSNANYEIVEPVGLNLAGLPQQGSATFIFRSTGTLTFTAYNGAKQLLKSVQMPVITNNGGSPNVRLEPLAQTFLLKAPCLVTGIDVYFKTVSTTSPITLQLRNVVNGQPGPDVIASKQINPVDAAISTSLDGSVATSFTFDDPAWLTVDDRTGVREYCFVLVSDSDDYDIYVAKVGESTLGVSPTLVSVQPYLDGVAFVSTNGSAWSALQDTDLKFVIKSASFNTAATNLLTFQSISTTNCTGMFLAADVVNKNSTNDITWEFQLNTNSGWKAFEPGTYVDFSVVATTVEIRAKLTGTVDTTPIIYAESLNVTLLFRQTSGEYVSKRATFQQAYNSVRMITRTFVPSQCTVKIYFTDETVGAGPGGYTWTEVTDFGTPITLPDGKYIEKDNNPGTSLTASLTRKFFRFRIRLETTDRTVTPRVRNVMAIVNA